jgi:septal ring factor EnvC (AmiA/AmiB activator)
MVRIKTVTYERLFSLTNYNNEKISFTAELNEHESLNPDIVIGGLFHKVTEVHKFFAYYRTVLEYIDSSHARLQDYQHRISMTEKEIEDQKITIAEMTEKLKTGDLEDERMRHACAGTSLKELNRQLESEKNSFKTEAKRKKELDDFLQELDKRVQARNLTLKGLDLPNMRLDTQGNE